MATAKPLIERIPKRTLAALRTRKIKNAEAAEELGVSETYLSRVVAQLQAKEPGKTTAQREAAAKLYKTRIEFRDKLAKMVMKGTMDMAKACKEAKCSERTMFRHIAKYREEAKKGPKRKRA
jgi:transposase